jgi:hypothetical protein
MDRDNVGATCLGITVSLLAVLVVGTLMSGWALATIWNWFIPPIFGLTSLTVWQAIGVGMVLELFTGVRTKSDSSDNKNKTYMKVLYESLIKVILTPVLSVGVAWIILQFAF